MKLIKVIILSCLLSISCLSASSIDFTSIDEIVCQEKITINEINLPKVNFEELYSQTEEPSTLLDKIKAKGDVSGKQTFHKAILITPMTEGIVIINGVLSHIGHYPGRSIITVLKGPYFGLQTTVAPNGLVTMVNRLCILDTLPSGAVVMRHEYPDATVLTTNRQIVLIK
ncbi:MAG: hypothetical protein WC222_01930 [Parachlamydiales bacterium]|jgi:hypothetical protein